MTTTNPAAFLTGLETRLLAALRKRAAPTPEGLRVTVSPAVLSRDLAVSAETTARGLAGLEKAGSIGRTRAERSVARGAAREILDQQITLLGTVEEAAQIVTGSVKADVDRARCALAAAIGRLTALQPDDGTLLREMQVQYQALVQLHQRIPRQGFGPAAAPTATPAGGKEA